MSNASAIGAKVRIKATIKGENVWQMREVSAQSGYNCQNSLRVHFGLGDAQVVDSLIIEWPLGLKEYFTNVQTKLFMVFQEPVTKGFLRANFSVEKRQCNIQETVTFINTSLVDSSENVTYSWDFDNDGIEDANEKNPSYAYSKAGTYAVKLTISNKLGNHTITREAYLKVLDPSGLNEADAFSKVNIYPNPFFNQLSIQTEKYWFAQIFVYDAKGQQITHRRYAKGQRNVVFNSQGFAKGGYSIKVILNNGQHKTFKVVKM
jgi:PKD repeat protein